MKLSKEIKYTYLLYTVYQFIIDDYKIIDFALKNTFSKDLDRMIFFYLILFTIRKKSFILIVK